MKSGVIQQQGSPRMLYDEPANAFVRDFVGKTLLFKGKVQVGNESGQIAIAVDGGHDCTVFGRTYDPSRVKTGDAVFLGVRPEDVKIIPANSEPGSRGVIGGRIQTALFVGERIEYQVEVDGQRSIVIYGDRHEPLREGEKVWLKLRPEGHSAWLSEAESERAA
jgi:ABC-type Fe3+/spermidine/putrescine transport system ATPase subunit